MPATSTVSDSETETAVMVAYFDRLVGDAVGVIGADTTLVAVMDHEDEQRREGGCGG